MTTIDHHVQGFFSSIYSEARNKFWRGASFAAQTRDGTHTFVKEEKGIQAAALMPKNSAHNDVLYLTVSGVHGVEGYYGAAVQQMLWEKLSSQIPPNAGLIQIFGLNREGMEQYRRTWLHNIDLNRAAIFNAADFVRDPLSKAIFEYFKDFLTPSKPYNLSQESNNFGLKLLLKALPLLVTGIKIDDHGRNRPTAKQIVNGIASGQYEHEASIFYGGNLATMCAGNTTIPEIIQEYAAFLRKYASSFRSLVIADYHSGYGRYGRDSYLSCMREGEETFIRMNKALNGRLKSEHPSLKGRKTTTYTSPGSVEAYTHKLFASEGIAVASVTLDSGCVKPDGWIDTIADLCDSDTLKRVAAEVNLLKLLRKENQIYRHNTNDDGLISTVQREMYESFCPRDLRWRSDVIRQSEQSMSSIIHEFSRQY